MSPFLQELKKKKPQQEKKIELNKKQKEQLQAILTEEKNIRDNLKTVSPLTYHHHFRKCFINRNAEICSSSLVLKIRINFRILLFLLRWLSQESYLLSPSSRLIFTLFTFSWRKRLLSMRSYWTAVWMSNRNI